MTHQALESDARYILLSQLAEGKRVLDVGCGDGSGLAALAEAGATELTGLGSNTIKVQKKLSELGIDGVEVRPDFSPPLSFADDSFDLIVCHDLPDRIADSEQWITELRRVLADDGYLAMAVANDEGQYMSELAGLKGKSAFPYEEAFEKLSDDFGEMALFGQSPVVASMFFDFQSEEEEPGLTFDGSLLTEDGEDPGWYVLIFGPEPPSRDDLLLVRLPFRGVVGTIRGGGVARAIPVAPRIDPEELDNLRNRIQELESAPPVVETVEKVVVEEVEVKPAGLEAHVEATLRAQEKALLEAQHRATETDGALNQARLELQRALQNAQVNSGLQSELAFAEQTLREKSAQLEAAAADHAALQADLSAAQDSIAELQGSAAGTEALQATLLTTQKVLAEESRLLRITRERASTAVEELNIERIKSYRLLNEQQKTNDDSRQRIRQLEQQLASERKERELAQTRLNEARERYETAEKSTGERADQIAQLEQSLKGAEQMFERTNAELIKIESGAQERIEEAQQLSEALIMQSAAAAEDKLNREIEKAAKEKEAAVKAAVEEIERASSEKIAEANKRADADRDAALSEALADARAEADERVKNAEERIGEMEERIREAEERAAEKIAEIQTRADEHAKKIEEDANSQLEDARNKTDEHLAALEKQAEEKLEEAKSAAQSRIDDVESKFTEALAAKEEAERRAREAAEAGEKLSASEDRASQLESTTAELTAKVDELTRQLSEVTARAEQHEVDNENAKHQLTQLETHRDAASELQTAKDALETEREALVKKRDELAAQLDAQTVAARSEIAKFETRVGTLTLERDKMMAERDKLAGEVTKLSQAMSAAAKAAPDTEAHEILPDSPDEPTRIDGDIMRELLGDPTVASNPPGAAAAPAAGAKPRPKTKDALGRDIEPTIEELEDLLQSTKTSSRQT